MVSHNPFEKRPGSRINVTTISTEEGFRLSGKKLTKGGNETLETLQDNQVKNIKKFLD